MPAPDRALLEGLSEPLASHGVDLEAVEVQRAGRRSVVRIVVDRDGGIDLDAVESVSRLVSGMLDEGPLSSIVAGPYTLEVTSPGVDRPLTQPRHWRRAVGRLVQVDRVDEPGLVGRVIEVQDDAVIVRVDEEPVRVPFDAVARAVVQVEFAKPDGG